MFSEFVFELFDGIGPIDRFGGLVGIGDVVIERGLQGSGTDKVIGLQVFALQDTEPDFELIEPGGIGRQPEHLKVQSPITDTFLLTEPAFQLFGGVSGSVVQDEEHRLHLATKGFGNDFLLDKGLEIDEALAAAAGAVDLSIGDREASKEMACAATMVARFVQHRLAWTCRARRLLPLACLDGGFLIEAKQPGACSQERARLAIGLEHWTGALQEGDGIMDMLPGVIAPGT